MRTSLIVSLVILSTSLLAQSPALDEETPEVWSAKIKADAKAAGAQLVEIGARALPLLRELLQSDDPNVASVACRVCQDLGERARPLALQIAKFAATAESWRNARDAVAALGAARARDPEALDAILTAAVRDVPALRQSCGFALWRCAPEGVRALARATDSGRVSIEHCTDMLVVGGVDVTPQLVELTGSSSSSAKAAGEALVTIGWRALPALRTAKRPDLVHRCLSEGPLRKLLMLDGHVVDYNPSQFRPQLVTRIEWETGYGHGHNLQLWRAELSDAQWHIEAIKFRDTTSCHRVDIPEARLRPLIAQLARLSGLVVAPPPPSDDGSQGSGFSSNDFHSAVRVFADDALVFEDLWAGYQGSDDLPKYARVRCMTDALWEATFTETLTPRATEAADLAFAERRSGTATTSSSSWVSERLTKMQEQLKAALELPDAPDTKK